MAVEVAAGPMQGQAGGAQYRPAAVRRSGQPILDADTIVAVDGRIAAVGKAKDVDTDKPDLVIDAKGSALAPGLIDSHCHPVFGDWTPRQNQLGWIDLCVNGGVTTFVSAGEVHLPGRPKDPIGRQGAGDHGAAYLRQLPPVRRQGHRRRALAEKAMGEEDYAEMARAGITMIGEIGLGTVNTGPDATKHVAWCRKHGHADHHSHRRPVDPRLQPHQPRGGAGGQPRRRQPHQRRAHRSGERHIRHPCDRPRAPSRSCTTATSGPPSRR